MPVERSTPALALLRDAQAFCRKNWWIYLVGGVASIIFGLFAFARPGAALFVMAMFFAAYLVVDGITSIGAALRNRDHDGWWLHLLFGGLATAAGIYLLAVPPAGMLALVYTVALIAIFYGVAQIAFGYQVRKVMSGEWLLYTLGALSIILGFMIGMRVAPGALTVTYLFATWAIVIGALRVVFAFRARSFGHRELPGGPRTPPVVRRPHRREPAIG